MKKILTYTASVVGAFFLFASAASAHVTVAPAETTQGKYEVFTVKVPSEKEEVSTKIVEVTVPEEVNISRLEPKAGWTYEVEKDETDKITKIIWTAEGDGLSPIEFGMFNMSGKVADDATEIVWKAYQTYTDGSVVEWVGAEGADAPASVTTVQPGDGSSDGHGVSHEGASNVASDNEEAEETTTSNSPFYLSIVALIAALVAVVLSLKKRKN
ncbi:YcnI family copper-binding membrane protein [Robertmurraya sp. Marseille-Q9965]